MFEALSQVIERASTDAAFRAQLRIAPEAVLAGYPLTLNEKAALLVPEPGAFSTLGVDVRAAKLGDTGSILDEGSSLPGGLLSQ